MVYHDCLPASREEIAGVSQELYTGMADVAVNPAFQELPYAQINSASSLEWVTHTDDLKVTITKDAPYGSQSAYILDPWPTRVFCEGTGGRGVLEFYLDDNQMIQWGYHEFPGKALSVEDILHHLGTDMRGFPLVIEGLAKNPEMKFVVGTAAVRLSGIKNARLSIDTVRTTPEVELIEAHDGISLSVDGYSVNFHAKCPDGEWNPDTVTANFSDTYSYDGFLTVSMPPSSSSPGWKVTPKGRRLSSWGDGIERRKPATPAFDREYRNLTVGRLREIRRAGACILDKIQADLTSRNSMVDQPTL